tara:strand:- start:16294 stop:16548 length:255 start_codon:yes stop_codon:yes gene_type:complete
MKTIYLLYILAPHPDINAYQNVQPHEEPFVTLQACEKVGEFKASKGINLGYLCAPVSVQKAKDLLGRQNYAPISAFEVNGDFEV